MKNIKFKKAKVPVQILMTRETADLCKKLSRDIPGCSRPEFGSINHFCHTAIVEKLKSMTKNHAYVNTIT